jgi:ABC-type multidrug transport system fused ATPase/permease subunit
LHKEYTGGQVIGTIWTVVGGVIGVATLQFNLPVIIKGQVAAQKIFETIDRKPTIDSMSDEGETVETINEIELKNVNFSYPTRKNVKVLNNLNLKIKSGTNLALVGPSGCGKSSIVALLQRFYDPESGSIEVNGKPITELQLKWWRNQVI